jgi:glycine cleavage system H protein
MSDLSQYRFTESHEWVHIESGMATVGITEHAQAQLGDVIFVELPQVGQTFNVGDKFGVIESVKAASELYSPVSGTVAAINTELAENPDRVNGDPYGEGWMLRLEAVDQQGAKLLDEASYSALVAK